MNFFWYFLGFFSAFFIIDIFKNILLLNAFITAEKKILLISLSLLQYKFHAMQIIEIVYDKASEQDSSAEKEKQEVIKKINDKFNAFGDNWIKDLKSNLPHKTNYNNWSEAIEYADKLINNKRL